MPSLAGRPPHGPLPSRYEALRKRPKASERPQRGAACRLATPGGFRRSAGMYVLLHSWCIAASGHTRPR